MIRGGSISDRHVYTGGRIIINGVVQSPINHGNHGDPITHNADVSEFFNGIDASGLFAIDYKYSKIGKSFEVTVPENLKENVVLSVENSILVVRLNFRGQLSLSEPIKFRIAAGALSSVKLSGQSTLALHNQLGISTEKFQVDLSGQSKVNAGWIKSKKVKLSLSDQSRMDFFHVDAGNQATILCSGQSEVTLNYLIAKNLDVKTAEQSQVNLTSNFITGGLTATGQSHIRIIGPRTSSVETVHAYLSDVSTIGLENISPRIVTTSIL
jgi:hypothetical protein